MLFTNQGRSVLEKTVPSALSTSLGLRTSLMVNNLYISQRLLKQNLVLSMKQILFGNLFDEETHHIPVQLFFSCFWLSLLVCFVLSFDDAFKHLSFSLNKGPFLGDSMFVCRSLILDRPQPREKPMFEIALPPQKQRLYNITQ